MKYYELSDKSNTIIDIDTILVMSRISRNTSSYYTIQLLIVDRGGHFLELQYDEDYAYQYDKDYKYIKEYLLSKTESKPSKPIEPIIYIPEPEGDSKGI